MGKPHVMVIPYPAQGHVIPMMELSQRLAEHGFKVTFVNTDFNHEHVQAAMLEKFGNFKDHISLVSIPDGIESPQDRKELHKLTKAMFHFMPTKLEELIEKICKSDDDDDDNRIACIVADECMGWALGVAEKMGLRRAAFWPQAAAVLASSLSIPKLIEDGIIDNTGTPLKKQMFRLSENMALMDSADLIWACMGDSTANKIFFERRLKTLNFLKAVDWIICNSVYDLEPQVFTSFPDILPIGPLLASNRLAKQAAYFWKEDLTCLTWLNQQPTQSVIYVAFGSITVFNLTQFQELALGLELTNKTFLWVVRPDMIDQTNNPFPKGYRERIGSHGLIVDWVPQQMVLEHPSVACFFSHCGWNSTLEGVSSGLPFLCWPYFADQFTSQNYICNIWKTGLSFDKDEDGIITRLEIKNKVEQILNNEEIKARAKDLKEKTATSIEKGGRSFRNFSSFVEDIRKQNT